MVLGFGRNGYYSLRGSDSGLERDIEEEKTPYVTRSPKFGNRPRAFGISLIWNLISTAIVLYLALRSPLNMAAVSRYTGLEAQPKRAIAYQWYTAYSTHDAGNTDKVDETWDRIVPEFGYVAVDHRWAEEQGALKTMDLPSDPTKGIYVLEAYHTMHCLVTLRKSYFQAARGEPRTSPLYHISHCFDALRQYIQCTASDDLLYSWGNHSSGDGQVRQCRDWNYLRDWVLEHSTCDPVTGGAEPILASYNFCDFDSDGLLPLPYE